MPINLPQVPFKLTAEDMGAPDLVSAVSKGLQAGFLPRSLPADLALKQAQARSKDAYSSLLLPQIAAKIIASPGFDTFAPAVQKQIQNAAAGAMNPALAQNIFNYSMGSQQQSPVQTSQDSLSGNSGNAYTYDSQGRNPVASDAEINEAANRDPGAPPEAQGQQNQQQPQQPQQVQGQQQMQPQQQDALPSENKAAFTHAVELSKQMGKNDADIIKGLESDYQSNSQKQFNIDSLKKNLLDPQLQAIRNVPAAGRHELAYYARYGTPEQQRLASDFISNTKRFIMDSIKDFPQRFTNKDLQFLETLKINAGDTIDSAKGKLESLSAFTDFASQRSKLAAQFMRKNQSSVIDALDYADKNMDGNAIREKAYESLYPNDYSPAAKKLAKTLKIPDYSSYTEDAGRAKFKKWLSEQNDTTKAAVKIKLRNS